MILTKWQLFKILWALSMAIGAVSTVLDVKPLAISCFLCALLVSIVSIVDTVRS